MSVGLVASLWLCAAVSPPVVPKQWTSDLRFTAHFQSGTRTAPGTFSFDAIGKRQHNSAAYNLSAVVPLSWVGTGREISRTDLWTLNDSMFTSLNGRGYLTSNLGFDKTQLFAWVPISQYAGNTTIDGQVVNTFVLNDVKYGVYHTYYVKPDGTPVGTILNLTHTTPPQYYRYDFANVRALNASVFDTFDKTAAYQFPVCPVSSVAPVTLDMYIFHPRAHVNISGQDTADLAGDTAFVCADALSNNTANDHYDVVSWYKVQVLPVWGRYESCNGYPPTCLGKRSFFVGREAPFGLLEDGGQCAESDLAQVGTWWSLPSGGECGAGATPGDGSCTWKVVTRVKTIDAVQCLFKEQNMLDMCMKESRMPYPQAQKIFETAFVETDPSNGGCPGVEP